MTSAGIGERAAARFAKLRRLALADATFDAAQAPGG
jgi:hypothetical protein